MMIRQEIPPGGQQVLKPQGILGSRHPPEKKPGRVEHEPSGRDGWVSGRVTFVPLHPGSPGRPMAPSCPGSPCEGITASQSLLSNT